MTFQDLIESFPVGDAKEGMTMAEKPKTVRVRIAVAIDEYGHYFVVGWDGGTDKQRVESAREFFESANGNECVHFIEADVPLPVSETIEGKVNDD